MFTVASAPLVPLGPSVLQMLDSPDSDLKMMGTEIVQAVGTLSRDAGTQGVDLIALSISLTFVESNGKRG